MQRIHDLPAPQELDTIGTLKEPGKLDFKMVKARHEQTRRDGHHLVRIANDRAGDLWANPAYTCDGFQVKLKLWEKSTEIWTVSVYLLIRFLAVRRTNQN